MPLNEEEVQKIAHLARLRVTSEEAASIASELSEILELVATMARCPTDDVTPMAHPMDAVQRLRNDEVAETDARAQFQAIAPAVENGYYLVPKVIE